MLSNIKTTARCGSASTLRLRWHCEFCRSKRADREENKGMTKKIFISMDIEGVAGVVIPEQGQPGNLEYEHSRRLMTEEANAAVAGAFDGGATEVMVNDSHGP